MNGVEKPGCEEGQACGACLSRSWLLARLAGHLDRVRGRIGELLALDAEALIAATAGHDAATVRAELSDFEADRSRAEIAEAGLLAVCRCSASYPSRLRDLSAPPAVLHLAAGEGRPAEAEDPGPEAPAVAIVGAHRAGPYGLGVAGDLARGLAAAGLRVISGLALGVDSAAHEGALAGGGTTVAVLPAAPQRTYPASRRGLHRRILAGGGVAVSELGPGVAVRRWMFPARNRIIAALSDATVVVAAGERSGAMVTARAAQELGRLVGAVPGPVGAPLSRGPHDLLRAGARLVADPADVLDALLGPEWAPAGPQRPAGLDRELERLLAAIGEGRPTAEAFASAGLDVPRGMAALAALELVGYVRRGPGGRYMATM